MITGSRGSTYSGASFTATKAGSSMGTIRSRGSSVSKPRSPIFRNVKFVSQRHSVFSRTARDRSAASSIFHSDPGTDLPVASGSVAADVSVPSGVGISTASATGTSVGVGDGSTTCAAAGTASPLAGEPPHPTISAAAAAIRKTPNRRLMRSFPVARTPGIRFSDN